LEEAHGNEKMVETIMSRAVSILEQKGCTIDREQWITEAEQCESENAPLTCQAIISSTIGIGLEEEDMKSTWIADAEACTKKGHITTARAIYAYALKVFPHKKGIWRQAAFFTKLHGTPQALDDLLALAVKACPKAEVLWLMSTKEKWLSGDVSGAREIMVNAFSSLPDSEQIWLAAIKLEVETGEFERGRALLKSAREKANTKKIWMKSALLERQLGNHTEALSILEQAIAQYPAFDKLWMMKGQI
jgi:pre-mRNA-processing factor 6